MKQVDVEQMSTIEKLQIIESIWDSLRQSPTQILSPDWHDDVLDTRRQKILAGEARFLTLDQVKKLNN